MAENQMAESPGVRDRRLVRPRGSRPYLGALLLGDDTEGGKLIYAGRVGTGCQTRCWPIFGADSNR